MFKVLSFAIARMLTCDAIGPEQIVREQPAEWLPVVILCVAAGLFLTAAAVAVILIVVFSKKKRKRQNGQGRTIQ